MEENAHSLHITQHSSKVTFAVDLCMWPKPAHTDYMLDYRYYWNAKATIVDVERLGRCSALCLGMLPYPLQVS